MTLSKILWDLHHSSDVGNAVEGLAELAEALERDLPIHKANTDKLAELVLYCVQRKIGRANQEAHEAMMIHCDALTAQLEECNAVLKKLLETPIGFGGSLQADGQFYYKVAEPVFKKAESALSKTRQQHLAEIKAMAIEEAIGECLLTHDDNAAIKLFPFGYLLPEKWLLQYAEKVRRGDEP